jgi:tetratricopeptide (TPR) repeat protein
MLGAARAGSPWFKKTNADSSKNLILRVMKSVLHIDGRNLPRGGRRPNSISWVAVLAAAAAAAAGAAPAFGQMQGGQGMGRPSGMSRPSEEIQSTPPVDKPDAAATKAYTAGKKTLAKAKDFENAAAAAQNPDKRSSALEKMGDAFNRALDQFTEALSNKGDMYDAWNEVGYIHLRLGAYAESIDDYNHTLALRPDLYEAVFHRAEAYLATDRLENAEAAYMDLFNHARPLADQLMLSMQNWLAMRRANSNGMRAADVDAFDKWLQERDGIAKQTASLPR